MTPAEANVLLTKAALLDPRMKRVNAVEQADMATAWSEVLDDVSLEAALRVLPLHYRRTDVPLTPSAVVDLLDEVTSHRPPNLTQQRLQALRDGLTEAGVTPQEYEAARARLTDAELQAWLPASVRALEGGAAPSADEREQEAEAMCDHYSPESQGCPAGCFEPKPAEPTNGAS